MTTETPRNPRAVDHPQSPVAYVEEHRKNDSTSVSPELRLSPPVSSIRLRFLTSSASCALRRLSRLPRRRGNHGRR